MINSDGSNGGRIANVVFHTKTCVCGTRTTVPIAMQQIRAANPAGGPHGHATPRSRGCLRRTGSPRARTVTAKPNHGNGEAGEAGEDKKRILSGVCCFEIPPFCISARMVYLKGFVVYIKSMGFCAPVKLPNPRFRRGFLPGGFPKNTLTCLTILTASGHGMRQRWQGS